MDPQGSSFEPREGAGEALAGAAGSLGQDPSIEKPVEKNEENEPETPEQGADPKIGDKPDTVPGGATDEPAKPAPTKATRTTAAAVKAPAPPAPAQRAEKRKTPTKTKPTPQSKSETPKPAVSPKPPAPKPAPRKASVTPEPARVKRKSASNTSDVNSLLNQLNKKKSGGQGSKDSGANTEDSNLPAKLGASAVRGTLKKRHGVFRACYKKMVKPAAGGALVKTTFVIKGSGAVSQAQILAGAGTNAAVQACLVKALKGTRFPRFKDPQMTVNYPISLR